MLLLESHLLGSVNPSPLGDWDATLRLMQDAKPGSHTVWDCKYHVVWITKYRFPVLGGDVGQRARELLREIARAHEMIIYAGSINRDHVHMLIGIPPHLSVSGGNRSHARLNYAAAGMAGVSAAARAAAMRSLA